MRTALAIFLTALMWGVALYGALMADWPHWWGNALHGGLLGLLVSVYTMRVWRTFGRRKHKHYIHAAGYEMTDEAALAELRELLSDEEAWRNSRNRAEKESARYFRETHGAE